MTGRIPQRKRRGAFNSTIKLEPDYPDEHLVLDVRCLVVEVEHTASIARMDLFVLLALLGSLKNASRAFCLGSAVAVAAGCSWNSVLRVASVADARGLLSGGGGGKYSLW